MEDLEEEWEIVSRDAFLDDEDTKIILEGPVDNSSISTVFDMEHFVLPSSKSMKIPEISVMPNQKHSHEVPGEGMIEDILHASILSNTGPELEDTKQQDTKEDDQKINVSKETKGANILCKRTLGGLLAICSFAAAAIICIVILRKRWPRDQMLHLQIYTGDAKVFLITCYCTSVLMIIENTIIE